MKSVTKYAIEGDPESREYLTELEALTARAARNLDGQVVSSK
jgi:hypothetical protein